MKNTLKVERAINDFTQEELAKKTAYKFDPLQAIRCVLCENLNRRQAH